MSTSTATILGAHTALELSPQASGRARRWARSTLRAWSYPALDGAKSRYPAMDDIELVISELVTNAVTHACGPIRARLDRLSSGAVRVCVDDGGSVAAPHHTDPAEHGRGLPIMAALSTHHGQTRMPAPYRARWWATLTPQPH
ncbi:ATP-binding protein [Streptomyces sp. NPDC056909]|uniref:ATP-binding protein n=1 Tax=Streptomyces sp. NPDC056909 TaxID=3345963 RepID=UPI0036CDC9E9